MTGAGVRATVNGRVVLVGRPGLLADAGIDLSTLTWRSGRVGSCPAE
jgi:cation transport ATPase